jgi:two-component system, NarL family, invasion response regulator UvrY
MGEGMTSIVLADDHRSIRRFVRIRLEEEADISVIGEAANGIDAVKIVAELKPDVLITDLSMPGLDGIEVTRRVRKILPQIIVIILSNWDAGCYVEAAKQAGAVGYIAKNSADTKLVPAIRAALDSKRNHNGEPGREQGSG